MDAIEIVKQGDAVNRGAKGKGGRRWAPSNTPLSDAQSDLAADWVPYAKKYAKQCSENCPYLHAEFLSDFMFALIDAARNFDPEKNVKFFTYLKWHLKSARNAVLKRNKPKGYRASIRDLPEPKIVGIDSTQHSAAYDEDRDVEAPQIARQRMRLLKEPFLTIVREYYFSGKSFVELAQEWGKSPRMIRRLHKLAIDVMRGDAPASRLDGYDHVMPSPDNCFGRWLRKARQHRRMSQRQLGDMVHKTQGYISHIEQGLRPGSRDVQDALTSILGSGAGIED